MNMSSSIESGHPLLEVAAPAYSNVTVRRAFIVWLHCGQRNTFKDVCNYYHYLEMLENQLPAEQRATSRYLEFNMFSTPPPTSPYLNIIFPKLYTLSNVQHYIKKANPNKNEVFNVKPSTDIKTQNNITTHDILKTSDMIRKYCRSHMTPLPKFLTEFQGFAKKCNLNYTVSNVAFYIQRKMVEEELLMVDNYAKSMHFLAFNDDSDNDLKIPSLAFTEEPKIKQNHAKDFSNNSQKQITTWTKDGEGVDHKYWNDLVSNYNQINKSSFTRT